MPRKQANERSRAPRIRPADRRPIILDAALPIFAQHGYPKTSMEAIAAAVGVTKPVLYHAFPSKRALFRALVDREERRLLTQIAAAFPADVDAGDVQALLASALSASFAAVAAAPLSWQAVFDARNASDPEISVRVQKARSDQVKRVEHVVERTLADRGAEAPERVAVLVARIIIAVGDTVAQLLLEDPDTWKPDELASVVAQLLSGGLNSI
jgi:AcrR family transcriptional regulator